MKDKSSSPETSALPEAISQFAAVPLKHYRHDGWTPKRQRAFIEALVDHGSVGRACKAVNMSRISAYRLRNLPQGGDFRRAWDAAIDMAVEHLKDIAFERAVEGQLEPVWQKGKLMGHKRKYSDGILMFLLRQYGVDENGRNVTVNYVKTKASVAAREGEAAAEAEATTMTVRKARPSLKDNKLQDKAAALIAQFSGVELDAAAQDEITATLVACAKRQREIDGTYDDPEQSSFTAGKNTPLWLGNFEPPHGWVEDVEPFDPAESSWQSIADAGD